MFSLSREASKSKPWWEKDTDVWADVNSPAALEEALRCPEFDLCVVDWFATWCHGCRKTSPILTEIASDPYFNHNVKFIRVCVDSMADYARKQGVKALPYVSIYDNQGEKLLAFGAAASKAKTFRKNIEIVMQNLDKDFRLDPNGFAIPLDRIVAEQSQKEMERAVQELKKFKSNLQQQMKPEHPPPRRGASGGRRTEQTRTEAKQKFLDKYGTAYGYRGLLNSMYDYELGARLGPDQHYLDYMGSSVYTETQLTAVMEDLRKHVFGNPHSENPSSSLTRDRIEEVRRMVLDFFDADPRNYQVCQIKCCWSSV